MRLNDNTPSTARAAFFLGKKGKVLLRQERECNRNAGMNIANNFYLAKGGAGLTQVQPGLKKTLFVLNHSSQ